MDLQADDFTLFGLSPVFVQQRAAIDAQWKALQAQVHPDRFAAEGAAAQRVAMQWAVRVNEAYQRLKDPLPRATYLCELRGQPVDAERNTAMPPAFLMQQMQWREALDDARDADAVSRLLDTVQDEQRRLEGAVAQQLDIDGDAAAAAATVRAWMFLSRFVADIDKRLAALEG